MADYSTVGMTEGGTVYGTAIQAIAKALRGNGICANTQTSTVLKVTQKGTGANMSVDVAAGSCFINGTIFNEPATTNLVIGAAHATYGRYDLIAYDRSAADPAVVAGTAAASPNPPEIGATDDIPLAIVYVGPNVTAITDAVIFDLRAASFNHHATGESFMCGYIQLPIVRSTDTASQGSHYQTLSTTFYGAGYLKITSSVFPTSLVGYNVYAYLVANISNQDGGETTTVRLYDNTDAEEITTITSTSATPEQKVSAALTYGTANQIVNAHAYSIEIKTSVGAKYARVFDAAIIFYAVAI